MALMETRGLVKTYGRRCVVNQVDLDVDQGEIVGLLGPNGAGKTTTFRAVVGLVRPDQGSVTFRGADISHVPVFRRARLGIGYLAQEPSVFRSMTVIENLLAVLEWRRGLSRSQQHERARNLLVRLHLDGLADQRSGSLSGGEQRRIEIARVLALDPALILLDEPFANVDPITVQEIQQILREMKAEGIGILLTDHSVRETLAVTDRSYIIADGRILRHGRARELVDDELVKTTYLGRGFRMPELESAQEPGMAAGDGGRGPAGS
jgi:lipopolysaccharide export system ATP-binding protein